MSKTQDLHDRLIRAHSWLEAAGNLSPEQKHTAFVFHFIAFNALYGRRQYEGSRTDAREDRGEFLKRIRKMHTQDMRYGKGILLRALEACSKEGGALIRDTFLRDLYWRREANAKALGQQFAHVATRVERSLRTRQYEDFLDLLIQRLTVLRNQVMHGCVTYGPSTKGIQSLENGVTVLRNIVPAFHLLMSKYGQHVDWPPVPYPRVGSERHPSIDQFAE